MDLDLTSLRCFVAITREGGVSRAARALNLAQPALSRRMRLLEEALGVPLLLRTRRGVAPTEAGAVLLRRAEALLYQARRLQEEVSAAAAEPVGLVRIGCPPSVAALFLGRLLARYTIAYPRVSLQIYERFSSSVRDALLADEIDIGISALGADGPDLQAERLFDEEVWLVAHPDIWPFGARTVLRAPEMRGLPLIYSSWFRPLVEAAAGPAAPGGPLRLQADAMTSIREFTLAGGGLLVGAPSAVHDLLAEKRLVGAPLQGHRLPRTLYRRSDRPATLALERLAASIREHVRDEVIGRHCFARPPRSDAPSVRGTAALTAQGPASLRPRGMPIDADTPGG